MNNFELALQFGPLGFRLWSLLALVLLASPSYDCYGWYWSLCNSRCSDQRGASIRKCTQGVFLLVPFHSVGKKHVNCIVFDKTGTLTVGKQVVAKPTP
ncbi:hypothetical protein Fmac_017578 [Flemingia macrophylla]|uniref:Uncharacterized protein n=1 Tax=Flemingia macrophylla TaxID=520843 RepID=A0ABD1M2H4_9FABA